MTAIQEVEWEECCLEPQRNPELERSIRAEVGFVPPLVRYLAPAAWVPRSIIRFDRASRRLAYLTGRFADLLALVVSRDNSCRYCFAATRFLLRINGMPEERIRSLEQDLLTADLSERERAGLEFARRLSRANPMPQRRELDGLEAEGWTPGEIVEIAGGAAIIGLANRVSTFIAAPPARFETLPDRLLVRWLAPLLRRILPHHGAGQPVALDPETLKGPFAYAVRALDGSPAAPALRDMLDEAWSSPHLTPRTKALVCAVVARGLGDAPSEHEAAQLLQAQGFGADDLEEVLGHLSSPRLDAIEALAVPFARETIWYRPAPIQRRVRALGEKLEPAQLVELIGIAAVANVLSRLGVLVTH